MIDHVWAPVPPAGVSETACNGPRGDCNRGPRLVRGGAAGGVDRQTENLRRTSVPLVKSTVKLCDPVERPLSSPPLSVSPGRTLPEIRPARVIRSGELNSYCVSYLAADRRW
jgi:hypothetical protein